MNAHERVARDWHKGSDHAADGVPFGGPLCNCLAVAGRIVPMLRKAYDEGWFSAVGSAPDDVWFDAWTDDDSNPYDPPGTRWEPTVAEEAVMRTVDAIRDVADDKDDRHVDQ